MAVIFDTQLAGIPCKCEVLSYTPAIPMRITGSGYGDADPPEPEEFEFNILDRYGKPAKWLLKKLTDEDVTRLCREFKQLSDT